MEDLCTFQTHHEDRRRLELACARALEDLRNIAGTPAAYKLYLQVPMDLLDPTVDRSKSGNVDLLVCRARDNRAVLGVVFNIGRDRIQIPKKLETMKILRFALLGDLTGAKLEETANAVREAVAALPEDAEKVSGPVTLGVCQLKHTLSHWDMAEPQRDALVRGQILYPDGGVTPYGASRGLVLRWVRKKGGWTDSLYVPVSRSSQVKTALDFSRELRRPGRLCLQERIAAAASGEVADDAYPAHMAALLDELLATPLDEAIHPSIASRVRALFPDRPDCCAAYGDALRTVHDLLRRFLEGNGQDRELYDLTDKITAALLRWLRRGPTCQPADTAKQQSLSQRLDGIRGTPGKKLILSAPLFGYLNGASARLGSNYPCTLFRSWAGNPRYTVDFVGKWVEDRWDKDAAAFDSDDPAHIPDALFYAYTLLVEPFCPDVDLWHTIDAPY